MSDCPLCLQPAQRHALVAPSGGYRAASHVSCQRCGEFVATMAFDSTARRLESAVRAHLSAIALKTTVSGGTLEITSDGLKDLLESHPVPSTREKLTIILSYVAQQQRHFEDLVPLDPDLLYPIAWADGPKEFEALCNALRDEGLLQLQGAGPPQASLTIRGRTQLDQMQTIARLPEAADAALKDPKREGMMEGRIFLGHGRSLLWRELEAFIRDRLRLPTVEFSSEATAGKAHKERLLEMLDQATFAFLVMTAEDQSTDGTLRTSMEN